MNGHFPSALFYHLAPDEDPGPLGDIFELLWDQGLTMALFLIVAVPATLYLRMRWPALVLAAALNLPMVLFVQLWALSVMRKS